MTKMTTRRLNMEGTNGTKGRMTTGPQGGGTTDNRPKKRQDKEGQGGNDNNHHHSTPNHSHNQLLMGWKQGATEWEQQGQQGDNEGER